MERRAKSPIIPTTAHTNSTIAIGKSKLKRRVQSRNETRTTANAPHIRKNRSCYLNRRNKQKKSCPNLSLLIGNKSEADFKSYDNLVPLSQEKSAHNQSVTQGGKAYIQKAHIPPLFNKRSSSRLDNVSPYSVSSRPKNSKRKKTRHRFRFGSNATKIDKSQIFLSPSFSPNASLNKFINGIGSPSVLKTGKGSQLSKISQGKISINGPIFLYLPGDNTKLFLQGKNEEQDVASPSLQGDPTQSFVSSSDLIEKLGNKSNQEQISRSSIVESEKEMSKNTPEHNVNNQQSSEKCDLSPTENTQKEKISIQVPKEAQNSDTNLVGSNINIALSDLNSSQNINCKIEAGSMHQISISSKAGDGNKKNRRKLTTHNINFKSNKNSKKSSRNKSKSGSRSRRAKGLNSLKRCTPSRIRIPQEKLLVKRSKRGKKISSSKIHQKGANKGFKSPVFKHSRIFKKDLNKIKKKLKSRIPVEEVFRPNQDFVIATGTKATQIEPKQAENIEKEPKLDAKIENKETHPTEVTENFIGFETPEKVQHKRASVRKLHIEDDSLDQESLGDDSEKEELVPIKSDSEISERDNGDEFKIGLTFEKKEEPDDKRSHVNSPSLKKEFSKT